MAADIVLFILCFLVISFGYRGAKQGFLRIAFSLVSVILTLWVVSFLSPRVSEALIERTPIYEQIADSIRKAFTSDNEGRDVTLPESQNETISNFALPENVKILLMENNTEPVYKQLLAEYFEDYVARFLSRLSIQILTYIISFLLLIAIIRAILLSLDLLDRIPVLHGINRLAGCLAGLLEGMIFVWLFFLFMTALSGTGIGKAFYDLVQSQPVLKYIYENNLFLRFLSGARIMGFDLGI